MQWMDLSDNQLAGPIPNELAKLAILEFLSLSQNQLTGCVPEGLRDVADSDLDELDLPFCDVLLSGLTVSPGSLITQFDPYQTDYTAAAGLSLVTVIPTNEHDATFLFLDETDSEVEDADNTLIGHQIDFGADLTTLRIRVVSQDDRATLTYTVVDLGSTYDADNNEVIDRGEAISAIVDYFNDVITREETIEVIKLYFSS